MKHLFEYINESREFFSPDIPIEKLEDIFQLISTDGLEYSKEINRLISKEINQLINKLNEYALYNIDAKTIQSILFAYFWSKNGMDGKYSKEGVEKFHNFITSQPLSRVKSILGAGTEGLIFNIGDDKVLKMLFDTDFMGDNKKMLNRMKNMVGKRYKTLPTIYKVTGNFIIREACNPNTAKVKEFYKTCNTRMGKTLLAMELMVAQHREDELYAMDLSDKEKLAVNWLVTCRKELKSIGYNVEGNFGDFKPANLGETKDGRIVYFDF